MNEYLTFDDVLLVPQYSDILPKDVLLNSKFSRQISLKVPIISAAMDKVTEHEMAIALALEGGLGIIHKNLTPEKQADEIRLVKRFENGFIDNPITVSPKAKVEEIYKIFLEKDYEKVPVLDENKKLLGLITELDWFWPHDKSKKVKDIMTPIDKLTVAKDNINLSQANKMIREKNLSILCVVDKKGCLKSVVTRRDLEKNKEYPNSNKDKNKSLLVGAAIGVGDFELERARLLVDAGVDCLVLDSAHGHSKNIMEMVKILKKDKITKNIDVVAGNIATKKAVVDLIKTGVDGIKVGIGPGSICTTRVVAGIGVPQLSAIMEAKKGLGKKDVPIIADGGIKYSGDIVKALAAGANSVMLGNILAGAEESPGETEFFNGRMYKIYRGMGSISAMKKGSKDRYGQSNVNDDAKFVPEGIEGKILYRGKLEKILYQLIGGLKSGMSYNGSKNISELQKKAEFIRVTNASFKESHPHDIEITKEAPNYYL